MWPVLAGYDWLETDILSLNNGGIEGIVSLLTLPEAGVLGFAEESSAAKNLGPSSFSFPVPDRMVPHNADEFSNFVTSVAAEVESGQAIGIHFGGSIGRATITAASLLVHLRWNADAALSEIEVARG